MQSGKQPIRAIAVAVIVTSVSILPVMLVGALAVLIRDDFGFSNRDLGAAVPAVTRSLAEALRRRFPSTPPAYLPAAVLSPAELEHLRSLGYVR